MSTLNPNENRVSSTSISIYHIIYLNMAKINSSFMKCFHNILSFHGIPKIFTLLLLLRIELCKLTLILWVCLPPIGYRAMAAKPTFVRLPTPPGYGKLTLILGICPSIATTRFIELSYDNLKHLAFSEKAPSGDGGLGLGRKGLKTGTSCVR